MQIAVIYDSQFGNTEKIARAITMALRDFGTVHAMPVDEADAFWLVNAGEVDCLIIGCPTQTHGISPAMRAFIDSIPPQSLRGLPTLCFDTRYHMIQWITGSAARQLARQMAEKGAQLIAPPQSFYVVEAEGPLEADELTRAADWAQAALRSVAVFE